MLCLINVSGEFASFFCVFISPFVISLIWLTEWLSHTLVSEEMLERKACNTWYKQMSALGYMRLRVKMVVDSRWIIVHNHLISIINDYCLLLLTLTGFQGGVASEYFDGLSCIGHVVSLYMCIYWYVDIYRPITSPPPEQQHLTCQDLIIEAAPSH